MTFAIKFDGFMRTLRADASQPHDAKKLCTAMPGTPDYDAWMNLYLNDQGGKLNIMLEDDNYTATWYVFVPRKNEETTEVTDTPTIDEAASDEPVAPKYKVLSTLVDTDTQKLYHVKLSRSHVVRKIAANS